MTITPHPTFHLVRLLEISGKQEPLVVHRRIVRRTVDMVEAFLVASLLKIDVDLAKLNTLLVAKVKILIEDPTMYLREGLSGMKPSQLHSLRVVNRHKMPLASRMNVSLDLDTAELSVRPAKPLVTSPVHRVLQQQVP